MKDDTMTAGSMRSFERAADVFHTGTEGAQGLPRYFAQIWKALDRLKAGRLDVVLPDGRIFRADGAQDGIHAEIHLHDPEVVSRLVREGELGFCEAYVDGEWSTPDLQRFLDLLNAQNDRVFGSYTGQGFVRAYERIRHWLKGNSKAQARKNISYHYDLGNDFYKLWLDETMTYSSALFRTGEETHEQAQRAKYAALVDALGVQAGDHVLEIGCGWGGFAEYAAGERGLRVTGLTISEEQLHYARVRIETAGLSHLVELKLQDYRDETGQYDGIASIEMFEAVGEAYWPLYFETVKACLKPDAKACLQIITLDEARFETYRKTPDFIQKHIFPGGMLPSKTALREAIMRAGLRERGILEFGESYSKTLRLWYEDFNARWPQIAAMGFDTRFRRMWNFYLTSCAASFHGGNCDVIQITMDATLLCPRPHA